MATQLGPTTNIVAQDVYKSSATQQHILGEKAYTPDGRTFRYVKVGAAALVPGNLLQGPAVVTNHVNLTPTATVAAGATTITVTLGATAATENQYAGGYLVTEIGTTGRGQTLLIASHPAASSSATLTVTLAEPFVTATSGTVTVSLIANPHNGVIQSIATTLTAPIVGAAVAPLAASTFGWIQTRGACGILVSGTPIVGSAVGAPTSTAGMAVADSAILNHVGVTLKAAITTQNTPVFLTID